MEKLNQVLGLLRAGQVEEAQEILGELSISHAWVRGLSFLRALTFLQGGELEQANESIAQGLARGERVSDSLALQAAIESARAVDPETTRMVDPRQRAKALLEEAIVVDPLNPAPFLELAAHYRIETNPELARQYLQAARDRLNPVGEAAVIGVTLALMDAEAGDGAMVLAGLPQPGAAHAFLSARQASERGDGAEVERQLRLARSLVGLEAFVYLMGDPALRGMEYPEELARP